MSHVPHLLEAFARLVAYPNAAMCQTAEWLYVVLQDEDPEGADHVGRLGAFIEQHELREVEEAFTSTFDVNPSCALEVGWHLFGEEYVRGLFLVRLRGELRKYGIPESTELPDHLVHVLLLLAAMPEDEASRFSRACVQPAVRKMTDALERTSSPYRHLVAALLSVLDRIWGPVDAAADRAGSRQPFAGDPLRDYPVAGVVPGCGSGCGSAPELVPLDLPPQPAPSPAPSRITNK